MRAAALLLVTVTAAVGTGRSAAASNGVEIKAPVERVCIGRIGGIQVGVRWASGPRRFRIRIYDPRGTLVFSRHGLAAHRWKLWSYTPTRGGTYRTRYALASRSRTYLTSATGCG